MAVEITVTGYINADVAERVADELDSAAGDPVQLRISDCSGGDVGPTAKIMNRLDRHTGQIMAVASGDVVSAGALIWISWECREIADGRLRFHLSRFVDLVLPGVSDSRDLRRLASDLEGHDQMIAVIVANQTGWSFEDAAAFCREDKYVDRTEAKKLGLLYP